MTNFYASPAACNLSHNMQIMPEQEGAYMFSNYPFIVETSFLGRIQDYIKLTASSGYEKETRDSNIRLAP